jgi:hypothetical protein
MEDKKIESNAVQPVESKRAYTPPAVITYGKLTELTASGTTPGGEGTGTGNKFKKT